MEKELTGTILEILKTHRICHVATVEGDRPLNSTVEYVSDRTQLYFVSIPGTQKVRNLENNPHVAVTITGPGRTHRDITGLQIFGKARRVAMLTYPTIDAVVN